MSTRVILTLAFLSLAGCASNPPDSQRPMVTQRVPITPSSSLDVTRSEDSTTMELLKEKAQELVRLKKRVAELEEGLGEAEKSRRAEEMRAQEQAAQVERLQQLLAQTTSEQAGLKDRVLSLEIEKLRLEKEILNLKLANLALEGK